jgi:mRNA interferase MazF
MANRRRKFARDKASYPKRGEVYLVALDPTLGHEIKKTRPALIIQNNTNNEYLGTTIVAPITSALRLPLSPVHVLIIQGNASGLDMTSMALLDQIRTVDKARLLRPLGQIDDQTLNQVEEAIKISLGLNGI